MWDKILQYLNDNKDALGWLFGSGVVLAVLGGIYRFIIWLFKEYRLRKIRTNDNFPFKVIPPNSNVAKEILGGPDDDPLADRNVPYQQRIQGRNTRRELEELIEDNRWLLIMGRTGLGKTREAVQLAQSLNNEGWTILYLTREAWLDAPAKLPKNVPERKLLFFLDDLNKKCLSSKAEIHPDAKDSLTLPINEPFQARLQRTLDTFDIFCGKREVRVVATTRNEKLSEFDEPSEWDKLGWTKYNDLWNKFRIVELPEPDETAEKNLLAETAKKAEILIRAEELITLVKRNDGTFRNLVENLSFARIEGVALSSENFRDTLKGTWQKRYQKAIQKYPEAKFIYDAIDIVQKAGVNVTYSSVLYVATVLTNSNIFARIKKKRSLVNALKQLVKSENIMNPRDGQVEAKGYSVQVESYLPELRRIIFLQIINRRQENVFIKLLIQINGIISLRISPRSFFVFEKKLSFLEKMYCSLISLESPLDLIAFHYGLVGFHTYSESLLRKSIGIQEASPIRFLRKKHEASTWIKLGSIYYMQGHIEDAVESYNRSLSLNSKNEMGWVGLGHFYRRIDRYKDSLQSFQNAVAINPNSSYSWNGLGNIYHDLSLFDKAIEAYEKAIAIGGSETLAYGNMGIVYLVRGDLEYAIEKFNKSIESNSKYNYAIVSLSLCYKMIGDNDKSNNLLESVNTSIKNDMEYAKACFCVSKGDNENGILFLKQALDKGQGSKSWAYQDPNFKNIRDDPRFKELVEVK